MVQPTRAAVCAALALVVACLFVLSSSAAASGPPRHRAPSTPRVQVTKGERALHRKVAKPKPKRKRPTLGTRAVQIASHLTGTPYSWGGESPSSGFDCSGLVRYVYQRLGVDLPHHAASQWSLGRPVSAGHLRAGDLVFFSGLGHVGIYAGHGKFIHSPRSGESVRWQSLSSRMSSYVGARRVVSA